jgi:hypothetical protein
MNLERYHSKWLEGTIFHFEGDLPEILKLWARKYCIEFLKDTHKRNVN